MHIDPSDHTPKTAQLCLLLRVYHIFPISLSSTGACFVMQSQLAAPGHRLALGRLAAPPGKVLIGHWLAAGLPPGWRLRGGRDRRWLPRRACSLRSRTVEMLYSCSQHGRARLVRPAMSAGRTRERTRRGAPATAPVRARMIADLDRAQLARIPAQCLDDRRRYLLIGRRGRNCGSVHVFWETRSAVWTSPRSLRHAPRAWSRGWKITPCSLEHDTGVRGCFRVINLLRRERRQISPGCRGLLRLRLVRSPRHPV